MRREGVIKAKAAEKYKGRKSVPEIFSSIAVFDSGKPAFTVRGETPKRGGSTVSTCTMKICRYSCSCEEIHRPLLGNLLIFRDKFRFEMDVGVDIFIKGELQ